MCRPKSSATGHTHLSAPSRSRKSSGTNRPCRTKLNREHNCTQQQQQPFARRRWAGREHNCTQQQQPPFARRRWAGNCAHNCTQQQQQPVNTTVHTAVNAVLVLKWKAEMERQWRAGCSWPTAFHI